MKVVDICCGAGGLSYGFASHKRFELLGGIDFDKKAIETYSKNFRKAKAVVADVTQIDGSYIEREFGEPDVVVCGFPCQIYSSLGVKDSEDERLSVMYACLRLIGELNPETVLLENVVGLISFDQGRVLKKILMFLENLGFVVSFQVINVVDYGVPQSRKRLLIVGSKRGKFKFSRKYKKKIWTVRDALGDLSGEKTSNEFLRWIKKGSSKTSDHDEVEHRDNVILKINKNFGFDNSYSRLDWDKPAGTVVSSFGALSGPSTVHPEKDRALTIREAARLQSFPDKFRFFGTKTDRRKQISNAVPPLFSIEISRMLWRHVKTAACDKGVDEMRETVLV